MGIFSRKSKDEKEKKKKLPLRRVIENDLFALRIAWRVWPAYLFFYFLMSVIYAVTSFFGGSFLLRMIVNGMQTGRDIGPIFAYTVFMFVLNWGIEAASNWLWNVYFVGAWDNFERTVRKMLFEKAAVVELGCYERPEFYDKYVRATEDAVNRVWQVVNSLDSIIYCVTDLVGTSLLIFFIDPALMVFAIIPILLGFVRNKEKRVYKEYSDANKPYDRRKAYIRRTFYLVDYAKEMRQTGMGARLLEDFRETLGMYTANLRKYGPLRATLGFVIKFCTEVVTILGATFYAIWRTVVSGTMLMGDCVVVINSISTISSNLTRLVSTMSDFHEHALYIEDMREFLDYTPQIDENLAGDIPQGGVLALEHVSFRYEGAETDALCDVSLTVRPGERVALVGHNGSGKTTLVKLLLHLYEPTAGKITLDGREMNEFNLSGWREQFSTVFQDYRNFAMTVGENVLLRKLGEADPDADRALIEQSLKEAGAWEKVQSLDKGVDTLLTREFDDKGAVLSGGESQKIALARVFAEPGRPFVLLDEPSSALDPIAEHKMFENMMRATEGRGVVFISHRLSSATTADRIYMMEKGRVIETGTHDELMRMGGKYADMFRKQAENYVEVSA